MIIVSTCLAGVCSRHYGGCNPCETVIRLVAVGNAIPICLEQLGWFATPRLPTEQVGDKVIRKDGADVTEAFRGGCKGRFETG